MHHFLLPARGKDTDNQQEVQVPPPPPPPDTNHGCTMPIRYWIRNSGYAQWTQSDEITPLLPIWLGAPGGEKSLEIVENCQALRILIVKMTSQKANPCGKLVAQLLAAKLNIARDADGSEIAPIIDEADAFLAVNDWNDRKYLTRSSWKQILIWTYKLHQFNKGRIGPGSCMFESEYGKRSRK